MHIPCLPCIQVKTIWYRCSPKHKFGVNSFPYSSIKTIISAKGTYHDSIVLLSLCSRQNGCMSKVLIYSNQSAPSLIYHFLRYQTPLNGFARKLMTKFNRNTINFTLIHFKDFFYYSFPTWILWLIEIPLEIRSIHSIVYKRVRFAPTCILWIGLISTPMWDPQHTSHWDQPTLMWI